MKHSIDELLDIVYRYYPRGVGLIDDGDIDVQLCTKTEEHDSARARADPGIEGRAMATHAASHRKTDSLVGS